MVRLAEISRYVLKNIKGCKQTDRDYTTRRDFLFLKVNKTFHGKRKFADQIAQIANMWPKV